jgi:uncharacterized protein YjdB
MSYRRRYRRLAALLFALVFFVSAGLPQALVWASAGASVSDNSLDDAEDPVGPDFIAPAPDDAETAAEEDAAPAPDDAEAALAAAALAEEAALEALAEITAIKSVYALVYLTDYYEVKEAPSRAAPTVLTVASGQTVEIRGVELAEGAFWYLADICLPNDDYSDFAVYSGYIEPAYLAYSDELFIAWETDRLVPWFEAAAAYDSLLAAPAFPDVSVAGLGLMSTIAAASTVNGTSADIEQFPASYRVGLYALKNKYPNWTFVKVNAKDSFATAVAGQMNPPHRSLVYSTARDSWKGAPYQGQWHIATRTAIEYMMDPRNHFSESTVFQFEQLTYNSSYHNEASLNSILSSTFMSGRIPDESSRTYAQAFMNLGQSNGISPYHLAARVRQEQGAAGTSPLISGTYPGFEGFYNFFNVGASGSTTEQIITNGLTYAKNQGWNTRYKSLAGGAATVGNNYIKVGQDTLYLQKFNVVSGNYAHQYMQNIQAPTTEAATVSSFYKASGALGAGFVFKIPVYSGMSDSPAPIDTVVKAASVQIDKTAYKVGLGETLTLYATVLPSNTTNKKVKWASSDLSVATIDADTGRLTPIALGETTVTVTTADGTDLSHSATVRVTDSLISYTLNHSALILKMGADETETAILDAAAYATNHPLFRLPIRWESSNENVVTVTPDPLEYAEDGDTPTNHGMAAVKAVGPGNAVIIATIAISTSNPVSLTCLVNVQMSDEADQEPGKPNESGYPLPQNERFAAVAGNVLLESYAANKESAATLRIKDQYGELVDNSYFSFASANPAQVTVNGEGQVAPAPGFAPTSNAKVAVTATLRNDPLGRKVAFSVTVVPKAQTKALTLSVSGSGGTWRELVSGEALASYFAAGQTYTLRAAGGDGSLPKVKWSATDTSVVRLQAGADNTVTVTVLKAGSARLNCQAQDDFKETRSVVVDAISTAPLAVANTISINKSRTGDTEGLVVSEPFRLVEMNGGAIEAGRFAVVSLTRGKEDLTGAIVGAANLVKNTDGTYQLAVKQNALARLAGASHRLTVNIPTSGSPRLDDAETIRDNVLAFTLNVASRQPTVSFGKASLDVQDTSNTAAALTYKATSAVTITGITPVAGQKNGFDQYLSFEPDNAGGWQVRLTEAGKALGARTLTGTVNVAMAGYNQVSSAKISVVLRSAKLNIVASQTPQVQYAKGSAQAVSLLDKATGQTLTDYEIVSQTANQLMTVEKRGDGALLLGLPGESGSYKNSQTLTATLTIRLPGRRDTVNAKVSMKVYKTAPALVLGTSTFTLNTGTPGETAVTTMGASRANQHFLPLNGWRIYQYNSAKKTYEMIGDIGSHPIKLSYNRLTGQFAVSLNQDNMPAVGTYKFRLSGLLDNFPQVSRDLTVVVNNKAPSARIAVSGKMDLLRRAEATMSGKITLGNTNGQVVGVTLLESAGGAANQSYYAVLKAGNAFDIRLRSGGVAYAKATVIPVRLTLRSGTVIDTTMTVKPSQSVPKVENPAASTFYLGSEETGAAYQMGDYVAAPVSLAKVRVEALPDGLSATVSGETVTIGAEAGGPKKGTYSVKVSLYFKGAQPLAGFPDGKPVTKTIKIIVK